MFKELTFPLGGRGVGMLHICSIFFAINSILLINYSIAIQLGKF